MLAKSLAIFGFTVLAFGCKSSDGAKDNESSEVMAKTRAGSVKKYDFLSSSKSFKNQGIEFFFSDIPSDQKLNVSDLSKLQGKNLLEKMTSEIAIVSGPSLYQLRQVYDSNSEARGQVIGYHNRSDDTDTNIVIKIADDAGKKLKPNTKYKVSAKLEFYTQVTSASFGVGGSADSNAYGMIVSPNPFVLKTAADTGSVGPKHQLGQPASFFKESNDPEDIASDLIGKVTGADLQILLTKIGNVPEDEIESTGLKVLTQLVNDVWSNKPVTDDSLTKKVVAAIDAKVSDKISKLSPEEIDSIKALGGGGGAPVAIAATTKAAGVSYLRTYTKDESGKELRVGVPAGDCISNINLNDVQKWICTHYSYMGRINNGKNEAGWLKNSISTQKPVEITTDAQGSPIYVNLTSHSGFEGLTVFYVSGVQITLAQ